MLRQGDWKAIEGFQAVWEGVDGVDGVVEFLNEKLLTLFCLCSSRFPLGQTDQDSFNQFGFVQFRLLTRT